MTLLLASLSETGAEQPLIDIDGTVFIQLGIFLLLFLLMRSLVFQPFLRMIEQRHQLTDGSIAEAEAMLKKAEEQVAAYETAIAKTRSEALEDRAKIRVAATVDAKVIVDAARAETTKEIATANQRLAKEGAAARQELNKQSVDLGRQVAEKILAR
jgi:F-type H+-transporting ATPase subunit b